MAKQEAKLGIDGDASGVLAEMRKLIAAQNKVAAGIGKITRLSRTAQTQARKINQSMISGVAGIAKGYVGAAAAVGTLTAALRAAHTEKMKAAQSTQQAEFDLGALSQLAGGSEKKYRQLIIASKLWQSKIHSRFG